MARRNIPREWRRPPQPAFGPMSKHHVFIDKFKPPSRFSSTACSTTFDQLQQAFKSAQQALCGSLHHKTLGFDPRAVNHFPSSSPRPAITRQESRLKNAPAPAPAKRDDPPKRATTDNHGHSTTGNSKRRRLNTDPPDTVVYPVKREVAEAAAFQEFRRPQVRSCRVYWTDAAKVNSGKDRPAGAAVVFRDSTSAWIDRAYRIEDPSVDSGEAELFAISKALHIARDDYIAARLSTHCHRVRQILVYTDYLPALVFTKQQHDSHPGPSNPRQALHHVQQICTQIAELQRRGLHVQLRWVPAHAGVPGNVRADTVARYAVGLRALAGIRDVEGLRVEFLELQKGCMRLLPVPGVEVVGSV